MNLEVLLMPFIQHSLIELENGAFFKKFENKISGLGVIHM